MTDLGINRGAGYLEATYRVLKTSRKPLNCREIIDRALESGLLTASGKTPEKSLHAMLARYIARAGSASVIKKAGRGLFELR